MKRILTFFLALLLLCGCARTAPEGQTLAGETASPETSIPDGNPDDATCKGSYTRDGDRAAVIARLGDAELTNGELAVWY